MEKTEQTPPPSPPSSEPNVEEKQPVEQKIETANKALLETTPESEPEIKSVENGETLPDEKSVNGKDETSKVIVEDQPVNGESGDLPVNESDVLNESSHNGTTEAESPKGTESKKADIKPNEKTESLDQNEESPDRIESESKEEIHEKTNGNLDEKVLLNKS